MDIDGVAQLLRDNPAAEEFRPYCHLSPEADALTVYFKGDADFSKRLTDSITLFLAIDTHEVVGCRIKGIRSILDDLPNFLRVQHGAIDLSVVFLSFRSAVDGEEGRRTLNAMARAAQSHQMTLEPVEA
jgi:hypothetical protein